MLIVSKCDTINAALFYLCKVVEGNMSRTFTFRQLTSCLEVRENLKRLTDPNIPLFFTKQDGGRRRGEGLRERYSCDSCDSCDSFQRRGYMNSGCFQIVIIIFNLLYIYLYIL